MNLSIFRFGESSRHSDSAVMPDVGEGRERNPYHSTAVQKFLYHVARVTPPAFREGIAEAFLRRANSPGPAAEHVFQRSLGLQLAGGESQKATTVAKAADKFYERQYRQHLNPQMGVFATTATQAVISAGRPRSGWLWRRHRPVDMAMAETVDAAGPILVIDHRTVAVPFYLPLPINLVDWREITCWLDGGCTAPPASLRQLICGETMRCAERGASARRRPARGSMLAVVHAALGSRKLAILALHPYDPDAMGLHITIFGVEAVAPETLMRDHGLETGALDSWLKVAERRKEKLLFLVGGIEEAFTQCSQNLFIKRPVEGEGRRAIWSNEWAPCESLESLIERQFEIFQGTVSASGLPGVSPRNGDIGLAALVVRRGGHSFVLNPYFTGNGVHGHAAKLWSNPSSSLLIWDDHTTRCALTVSGPSRIASHAWVAARFPEATERIRLRCRRNGSPADDPEYWFVLRVADIWLQDEVTPLNSLDPARATCSIHAAGPAHHGKKPAYFAADSLPLYNMRVQHNREERGRPLDATGEERRYWLWHSAPALEQRHAHLAQAMSPKREAQAETNDAIPHRATSSCE